MVFNLTPQVNKYVGVILIVLLAVIMVPIGLNLMGLQLGPMFSSIGNITTAFKTADLGDATLNGFVHAFGVIIGIILVLLPIGLVFLLGRLGSSGGSKSS